VRENDQYRLFLSVWHKSPFTPEERKLAMAVIRWMRMSGASLCTLDEAKKYLSEFNSQIDAEDKAFEELRLTLNSKIESRTPKPPDPPRHRILFRKCPDCGKTMGIFPVNYNRRTVVPPANGERLQSVWFCPDEKGCGYEDFSTRTVKQEMAALYRLRLSEGLLNGVSFPEFLRDVFSLNWR